VRLVLCKFNKVEAIAINHNAMFLERETKKGAFHKLNKSITTSQLTPIILNRVDVLVGRMEDEGSNQRPFKCYE
jgi:hypothetical protein